MPKQYINKDATISTKEKTLGELCEDIDSIVKRLKNLETVNSEKAICSLSGGDDLSINIPSAWANVTIPMQNLHWNSNANTFQHINGGIKILKDGYYMISGSINTDGDSGSGLSVIVYTTSHGYIFTVDMSNGGGMMNGTYANYPLWVGAGTIVMLAFRAGNPRTYNIRRGRSMLTVERII